jgi:para-nitrobenzyl esterase
MNQTSGKNFTHNTCLGLLTGRQEPAHQAFLGIRYAQPPMGKLRFQPPQRIDAWEGIYDATRYGPIAPQGNPDNPPLQLPESEDCLVLNIYTPAADKAARPVMVFIHGGGFVIDSGSRPRTYGGYLAECGQVVVVTIEYRMGAFGFLYVDGISPNLGLQDQICALQWVQRNIADFGGDPGNVTVFGESAGAMSIARLLVMPAAQGLFHKAILESGAFIVEPPGQNLRYAHKCARKLFKALKVPYGDVSTLQKASYEDILRAQKKVTGKSFFNDQAFFPAQDGGSIPNEPYTHLRTGFAKDIPILIGTNQEEFPIFGAMVKNPIQQFIMKKLLFGWLKKMGVTNQHIQRLLPLYRKALAPSQVAQKREVNYLVTDAFFRMPALLLAEAHLSGPAKTFFYCFAHPAPQIQAASHVLELYFVFGTLTTSDIADMMKIPGTEPEVHLSQQMMKAWSSFARSGDPNHADLPTWPPYDKEHRSTMFLQIPPRVVEAPLEEVRLEWEKILTAGNG